MYQGLKHVAGARALATTEFDARLAGVRDAHARLGACRSALYAARDVRDVHAVLVSAHTELKRAYVQVSAVIACPMPVHEAGEEFRAYVNANRRRRKFVREAASWFLKRVDAMLGIMPIFDECLRFYRAQVAEEFREGRERGNRPLWVSPDGWESNLAGENEERPHL